MGSPTCRSESVGILFLCCVLNPDRSITYTILVTDSIGCTAADTLIIFIANDENIFMPSVFSPNGDGLNDVLTIYASSAFVRVRAMRFFSRWGEVIGKHTDFPPNDPGYGWDGFFKGEVLNPGVYVWIAELELAEGGVRTFSGDVTLVR